MEELRIYALRVIAGALLCTLVPELLSGGAKDMVKAAAGMALVWILVSPLRSVSFSLPELPAVEVPVFSYEDAMVPIIKEETQAYILDKAKALGASLRAEVMVSGGSLPVPERVFLTGEVSAHQREALEAILWEDLGIAKEDQVWIGQP